MAVKPGWTGRVYEDFAVGDVYEHPLGRTLLAADNTWVNLLTQNTNLGWDEVKLPNPVSAGDTIYSRSEILETRESKSRKNVGIVKAKTTGFNQDGTVVIEFLRTFMVYRRGHVPAIPKPQITQQK